MSRPCIWLASALLMGLPGQKQPLLKLPSCFCMVGFPLSLVSSPPPPLHPYVCPLVILHHLLPHVLLMFPHLYYHTETLDPSVMHNPSASPSTTHSHTTQPLFSTIT